MATITSTFEAKGVSGALRVAFGDEITLAITGTFVATVKLQYSYNLQGWVDLESFTDAQSRLIKNSGPVQGAIYYRLYCSAFTSGTVGYTLADVVAGADSGTGRTIMLPVKGIASIGNPGWTIDAQNTDENIVCPASQTSASVTIPIIGLNIGDVITGMTVHGFLAVAGGGSITMDGQLIRATIAGGIAATGFNTDFPTVSSAVEGSVDLDGDNFFLSGLTEEVIAGQFYYAIITATTGVGDNAYITHVEVTVE